MDIAAIVTAFLVGFAMKYGGLCTYAAALQIVREQRFERLSAFLTAAAWAALVVVPMAWFWPGEWRLSATHEQWGMAIAGGAVLGLGAWLNRGCVFGTFVQLTGGNLSYVATLAGMVAGASGAKYGVGSIAPLKLQPSLAATPGIPAGLWLILALVVVVAGMLEFFARSVKTVRLRPVSGILVALVLGVGGGALFATVSGWDFASVLMQSAYHALLLSPTGPGLLAIFCTLLMVAGGIVAAVSQNTFAWQAPRLLSSLAHFFGGALMGVAAVILPGGNDGLLLSGLPALALHAILGFTLMLLTMLLLLILAPNDKGFFIGR